MRVLPKAAVALRNGRLALPNEIVNQKPSHAEALLKSGGAVPAPKKRLRITSVNFYAPGLKNGK